MKRIIEIDESLYDRVKEKIVALIDIPCLCKAVDDSKPYSEPTGDCISRELLKKDIEAQISDFNELNKKGEPYKDFKDIRAILFGLVIGKNLIDNAPTVAVNCKDCDGYEAGYSAGLKDAERPQGEWIDYSDEGYIECPFCGQATTCEDNIDELHYCWNCGAHLQKGGTE